jgi:hypothetical protein
MNPSNPCIIGSILYQGKFKKVYTIISEALIVNTLQLTKGQHIFLS